MLQARTARISVGASAGRNQGAPGLVHAARSYLARIDVDQFVVKGPQAYRQVLNRKTRHFMTRLPRGAANWGIARKLLNIFLRECLYTAYLTDRYPLERIEHYLELPLDSITSRELRKRAGRGHLPRWPGIKHLSLSTSDEYQQCAQSVAQSLGIARIHLDTLWWTRPAELGIRLWSASANGV
jgi:hypothetical protein